jgi:6-phosphogluconolactonase
MTGAGFCVVAGLEILGLCAVTAASDAPKREYVLYVGTYTKKQSKGIYAYRFDTASHELSSVGLAAETANPSFLVVDPRSRFLYAVNEIADYKGQSSGGVSAFAIDRKTGKLSLLNEVPSRGADPCYVAVDKTGKFVLVANYTGGSVAVFPVMRDGRLGEASAFMQHVGSGPNKERQEAPHAHWVDVTADNHFAIASDLGLDKLLVYRFDQKNGTISPNDPAFAKTEPGAGPRHVSFHPNGRFAYVADELQSAVSVFSYDGVHGVLRPLQTVSMLPKDFTGENSAAEIQVHPNGKFLFASNRGSDSIAVFSIGKSSGRLTLVDHFSTKGKKPRNFAVDPTGSRLFVANEDSDNIVVFEIDSSTGRLTPTGQVLEVSSPVCLTFVPVR